MLSLLCCTLGHLAARQGRGPRGPSLIVSMTAWKEESENNKSFVTRSWRDPAAAPGKASAQQHENAITPTSQERRSPRPQLVTDSTKSAGVSGRAGGRGVWVSGHAEPLQRLTFVCSLAGCPASPLKNAARPPAWKRSSSSGIIWS